MGVGYIEKFIKELRGHDILKYISSGLFLAAYYSSARL